MLPERRDQRWRPGLRKRPEQTPYPAVRTRESAIVRTARPPRVLEMDSPRVACARCSGYSKDGDGGKVTGRVPGTDGTQQFALQADARRPLAQTVPLT